MQDGFNFFLFPWHKQGTPYEKIHVWGWHCSVRAAMGATAVLLLALLHWESLLGSHLQPEDSYKNKNGKKKKKSETTVTDKVSAAITSEEKEKNLCNYRGRNCWRLKKICGMNKDLAVINRAPATGQICCALGRVKRAMNCFTSSDGEFLKKHVWWSLGNVLVESGQCGPSLLQHTFSFIPAWLHPCISLC